MLKSLGSTQVEQTSFQFSRCLSSTHTISEEKMTNSAWLIFATQEIGTIELQTMLNLELHGMWMNSYAAQTR